MIVLGIDETRIVKFNKKECYVEYKRYGGDKISMRLFDAVTKKFVEKCTIALPQEPLLNNCVFIDEFKDKKGMVKALVDAGVVNPSEHIIKVDPFGHLAYMCELIPLSKTQKEELVYSVKGPLSYPEFDYETGTQSWHIVKNNFTHAILFERDLAEKVSGFLNLKKSCVVKKCKNC